MRTSESTVKLIEALVTARAAFTPVRREATGQVGSDRQYKYADLASVLDAVMPALTANGLAILQAVDAETSTLVTRLAHVSGEWVEATYPLTITVHPQQLGSSLTYGRRYSLQSLLCLAAEDDDGAGGQPPQVKPAKPRPAASTPPAKGDELITQAQRKRMFAIATHAGWSTEQMKAWLKQTYGVESSKDLTVRIYEQVCEDFDRPPATDTDWVL